LIDDLANALREVWDTLGLNCQMTDHIPVFLQPSLVAGASQAFS